jgi:hypothetical protein
MGFLAGNCKIRIKTSTVSNSSFQFIHGVTGRVVLRILGDQVSDDLRNDLERKGRHDFLARTPTLATYEGLWPSSDGV